MSSYAIDGNRQELIATGIVGPIMEWSDTPDGRRQSDLQARDENTGMPLWSVEVVYRSESFGREYSVTAGVTVGAVERPHPPAYSQVQFDGLRVDARVNKAGGLSERWSAEAIREKPAAAGGGSTKAAA